MTDQAQAVESEVVEATPAVQPETTEVETEVTNEELKDALEAAGTSEEEGEPEFTEIEYEGQTYNVPEELKEAFLRQSDYTRKTQEVAESRKEFETQKEAGTRQLVEVQQAMQLQQQNLQGYAQVASLDAQIQQFEQVDWNELINNDPVEAQKLQWQYGQLKEQRNQAAQQISQREQQVQLQQQQQIAQMVEQGKEVLAKEIEGWSPEVASQLTEYGKTQGFNDAEMAQVIDPRHVKILHKAHLYDQVIAKAKTRRPAGVKAAPTKKVTSGRTASKDPKKMTTDEWIAWRNKQVANKSR
ncbi:hypothetical protein [Solemya elarraichensis gill symbiont]|uniref:Scaffolding protein n=1 Tax=Solemya elarraichensis gill symbiont TaxID=1918949 RepID=A0A1T2KVH6_9GAMM|nr:hypothetical protein [Solemya elarraichensis gill symbiont]OOZ36801.1 hypothetical protein BOW52_10550 [Solemya elarraichensis gill symbiont]